MIASTAFAIKELLQLYSPGEITVVIDETGVPANGPNVIVHMGNTNAMFVPLFKGMVMDDFAMLGKIPNTFYDHEILAKNWTVVRSTATDNNGEMMFEKGKMPAFGLPIVVNYEGRLDPCLGFLAVHKFDEDRSEVVFMELDEGGDFPIFAIIPTARTRSFLISKDCKDCRYIPQLVDGIIGWNYLNLDGHALVDRHQDEEIELFADCEFEAGTKKLISVGLVNGKGRCYYAYDQSVANSITDEWVKENVLPHLSKVPSETQVTELSSVGGTFYDWLAGVIADEQVGLSNPNANIRIRVDYSTEVVYLAEMLHRLTEDGIERFGKQRRISFQIDYVDVYPTSLRAAVRHNAAWDAVAMWHHLGYYKKRVLDRLMNSDDLGNALTDLYKNGQKAAAGSN